MVRCTECSDIPRSNEYHTAFVRSIEAILSENSRSFNLHILSWFHMLQFKHETVAIRIKYVRREL